MKRQAQMQQPERDQRTRLISAVDAVVPGAADSSTEVPEVLAMLWDRWDLARVFGKHPDTIHRWEQDGWITAIRRASGRIEGYPAEQVVAVAARLFSRFPHATFNEMEAERQQLLPLLRWVHATVRNHESLRAAGKEALLDALNLAALAESRDCLGETNVTEEDLAEHMPVAQAQLRARLRDPYARHLMLRAWRQAGAVLRVQTFKPNPGSVTAAASPKTNNPTQL